VAKPTVTDRDIARLDEERLLADGLYNEALTKVDRALVQPEPLPGPHLPPHYRHHSDLNRQWEILPADPTARGGLKAFLARLVWRVVAPVFQRQQAFNAALVGHINQQAEHEQEAREVSAALVDSLRREFDGLAHFQAALIQYLQQITLYVDTKDRREAGVLKRELEDRAIALAGGLNGLSDELLRRWESTVAREQRYEAAQNEIRTSLAGYQRTSQLLKRELERLAAEGAAEHTGQHRSSAPAPSASSQPDPSRAGAATLGTRLDSGKYLGFEDSFRGTSEDIRSRVAEYLPLFEGASDVLDIGCGRGEFLEVLRASDIRGLGVDINHAMVENCRQRGLDVAEGDAVQYLEAQADDSLGGILAVQVVEHLQADQLVRLLELAFHKLRPGSRIALETINPACWYAFFASYIRDLTHVHPVHPDTLRYLLIASGFQRVEIRYREPYPEYGKLQPVPAQQLAAVAPVLGEVGKTFNENVSKINALLFTYLDYAAIGEKM
jgi:SAM-dependent methyltransferase